MSIGAPAPLPHLSSLLEAAEVTYPMEAESGLYLLQGYDTAGLSARVLPAVFGEYAVTGSPGEVLAGRILPADFGAYSVTGVDPNLDYVGLAHHVMPAGFGQYNVEWEDAELDYVGIPAFSSPSPLPGLGLLGGLGVETKFIEAETGFYALDGEPAGITRTSLLEAATGYYAVTGQVALFVVPPESKGIEFPVSLPHLSLLFGGTVRALTLAADPGIYSVLGSDGLADFEHDADQGLYTITGYPADLRLDGQMAAETGYYLLTGQETEGNITGADRVLTAETGFYSLTGQEVGLNRASRLALEHGFYFLQGQQAEFIIGLPPPMEYVLPAETGFYVLTGVPAGQTSIYVLEAVTGFYNLTGQEATLTPGIVPPQQLVLDAETGFYEHLGFDARLLYDKKPGQPGGGPGGGVGGGGPKKRRRTFIVRLKGGRELEFETEDEAQDFILRYKKEAKEQKKPAPLAVIVPKELSPGNAVPAPKDDDEEIELILLLL